MPKEIMVIVIVAMVGVFALVSTQLRGQFKSRRNRSGASRDANRAALEQIAQQLAALQQSVDATALEVERLGEGQRFTTKILAEQKRVPEGLRQPERVITPH